MTGPNEQQQAIWYVHGLAEVLACSGSQDQLGDAIVRFDRYRPTRTPGVLSASSNALSLTARRRLDQWGFAVVDDVESVPAAKELVGSVGELIDDESNSQDAGTVSVHTAAPGRNHSPAYLALFCHRRRRRGAAHIDLLDMRKLVGALGADELALMTDVEMHFPGPDGGVHTTMLSADADGNTVTRFSYDLLTAADSQPLGEAGRRLAHRVDDVFGERSTRVVIPDGSLLIWDNQRMLHALTDNHDHTGRLSELWSTDWRRS
ncbi:MAG TPA: hypothetical protein VIQ11_20600 [Mycobacterium sp.]